MTENNDLDLRRFFRAVISLKWVYLLSFVIMMGLALTYCLIKQPQYVVKSTMLIEDTSNDSPSALAAAAGGMASMMKSFSIGGFGSSSVDNEVLLVNSHEVLIRTAKALGLNRNYVVRDGLLKEMVYPLAQIAVEAPEAMFDTLTHTFKVRVDILGPDRADVRITRGLLGRTIGKADNTTLPVRIDTELGAVTVLPTSAYSGEPQRIDVAVSGYEHVVDFLTEKVEVDITDKRADAINFELLYPNRERGKAILNTIMAQYNIKRLGRQHETALTEIEFLSDRIAQLTLEIDTVNIEFRNFRENNNVVSLEVEGELLAGLTAEAQTEMAELKAKELYYSEVLKQLDNPDKENSPLPAFDENSYDIVKDYNELLLAKKNLGRSARPGNPAYDQASANISELRQSIIKNISGMLDATRIAISSQQSLVGKAENRISQFPALEQKLIDISRERQLKNALYMFLLEKKESAMLKLYSNNTLGFVVDQAYTELKPSKKKAIIALLLAFVLALICPTVLALWRLRRDNKVRDVMDVAAYGFEDRTVRLDGNPRSVAKLRAMLLRNAGRHIIFMAGDAVDVVSARLKEACSAVDIPVESLAPQGNNDSLLTRAFADKLNSKGSNAGLTLVAVPDSAELDVAARAISASDAQLLLCLQSGESPRKMLAYSGLGEFVVTVAIV